MYLFSHLHHRNETEVQTAKSCFHWSCFVSYSLCGQYLKKLLYHSLFFILCVPFVAWFFIPFHSIAQSTNSKTPEFMQIIIILNFIAPLHFPSVYLNFFTSLVHPSP